MKTTLSSRERMLLAINHQEADHVPLAFHIFNWQPPHQAWNQGLDNWLGIGLTRPFHPEVTTSLRRVIRPDEPYPLLIKEYRTPKGTLQQIVRQTQDWPDGDDVPIVSDHAVSRSKKFAVSEPADLEKLPYLFHHPRVEEFKEHAQSIQRQARSQQAIVIGQAGGFGDYAAWLMGITNLMLAVKDRPAFVHQLLDTILEWEIRDIEYLLDSGVVDVIMHRGWYECSDFWSPPLYQEFIAPRLAQKIKLVHQANKPFGYIMSTGVMPLLSIFRELDFDILIHVDPVQGHADLPRLKETLGNKMCFWGGVNSAITLGRDSQDEIRNAVTSAISTLSPGGGHILSAADCLFADTPWTSVKTMIDRWREIGSYPIRA